MCPVCLATAAILAGSATGTGGLAALVTRTLRRKVHQTPLPIIAKKEDHDGYQPSGSSPQDGLSH